MFANIMAWYLLLKLLIFQSNELGIVSTLILFFTDGFSMVFTKLFFREA